jgi:hypothetical protein
VKRLFVLLMILVLPLRGWAGDVMGVQMAASGLPTSAVAAMPADCAMHSMHVLAGGDDTAAAHAAGTDACASCDLCLPMAELASLRFDVLAFGAHAAPPAHGVAFFSASPARALKPPIS